MSSETELDIEANSVEGSAPEISSKAKYTLGIWAYYFVAKLLLYWMELIGFHVWENIAFAVFILIPISHPIGKIAKEFSTVLLAVVLLYYDSWLPPIGRVISQASLVSGFSTSYLMELAGRFISLPVIALLVFSLMACWFVSRWLRLEAFVMAVMIGMPMMAFFQAPEPHPLGNPQQSVSGETDDWYDEAAKPVQATQDMPGHQEQNDLQQSLTQPDSDDQSAIAQQTAIQPEPNVEVVADDSVLDMDKVLQRFYKQESTRSISFPIPKPGDEPFDVIFLHVCSLSWDDLKVTGLDNHPLWRRFDILLTRFNSASTYSGPAAIRMQRATCGQSEHSELYSPAPEKCYLMDSLKQGGFEPGLVLNHDGHFDDFLKIVQSQGKFNIKPFPLNGAVINQYAFDDTPIYEDLSVLDRWLEFRQKAAVPRIAMYYNSISLHDGNHLSGKGAKLNSRENFKLRLSKFLDDIERFMQDIEKSGRRAVVAIVPEHGAALRGDKMQIAGLREIPSPAITLVPVGIKVIGTGIKRAGDTVRIGKPTSFMAISYIIAGMLERSPYMQNDFAPTDYVKDIPVTPFVSQNEDTVMAGYKGRYYLRQDATGWIDYTDF